VAQDQRRPRRTRVLDPVDTESVADRSAVRREFLATFTRGRGQDRRPPAEPEIPYQRPFDGPRRVPVREYRRDQVPGGVLWQRAFGGWICAPVAVNEDVCVVACLDGSVSGLRASDGSDLWRPVLPAPVTGAPVILPRGMGFDGAVFAAARDGSVHAIDLRHGDCQQVLPAGPAVAGSPVAVRNDATLQNVVYVVRADGGVYAIDPPRWKPRLLCRLADGASGAMTADPAVVAVADTRGTVQVVNLQTGQVMPRLSTDGQVLGSPVLAAGRVFAAATDGTLRAAGIFAGAEDVVKLGTAPVHAAPVYGAGQLYAGASDGRVHAYGVAGHGSSGLNRRWPPAELGVEITGLAVSPSGTLYAAAGYRVVSIDHRDGRLSGTVRELNCLVGAAPVISGDSCYVVGLGGIVEKIQLR
jgi:outer membrane protein assembly factor BamB